MVDYEKSAFFQDPLAAVRTRAALEAIIRSDVTLLKAGRDSLLTKLDHESIPYIKHAYLQLRHGKRTGSVISFEEGENIRAQTVEVPQGQPVIFTERILHRSFPNRSLRPRLAVNFRVTSSSALVYPHRLRGDKYDGVGRDITHHRCILISGRNLNPDNLVLDATAVKS